MSCEHCGNQAAVPKILPKLPSTEVSAFHCMYCGHKIEGLSLDYSGLQSECPSCQAIIDVPEMDNANNKPSTDTPNLPINQAQPFGTNARYLPGMGAQKWVGEQNERRRAKPQDNNPTLLWHLKSMVSFKGRITQTHYLFCVGINMIMFLLLSCVCFLVGTILGGVVGVSVTIPFVLFLGLFGLSYHVRRLHDAGTSGAMALIFLVPIFGGLVLFVVCALSPSEGGPNKYGPGPHKLFGMR